jgi:hypothetical protein
MTTTLMAGNVFHSRFQENGDIRYIDLAISCAAEVVRLTPESSTAMPDNLSVLGTSGKKMRSNLAGIVRLVTFVMSPVFHVTLV